MIIRKTKNEELSLARYIVDYHDDSKGDQIRKTFHEWVNSNFSDFECWKYGKIYVFPLSESSSFEVSAKIIYGCEINE